MLVFSHLYEACAMARSVQVEIVCLIAGVAWRVSPLGWSYKCIYDGIPKPEGI
jgi:hypothetical protein